MNYFFTAGLTSGFKQKLILLYLVAFMATSFSRSVSAELLVSLGEKWPPIQPVLISKSDLQLSVSSSRRDWLLGEEMLLKFCLKNGGTVPHDLPMMPREGLELTMWYFTEKPDGYGMIDNDTANSHLFSGHDLPTSFKLSPGEEVCFERDISADIIFAASGTYKLRIDAPIDGTTDNPEVASTEITLRLSEPNEAQARQIAEARMAKSESENYRLPPAFPAAYLPVFKDMAERGVTTGLHAMTTIMSPEATRLLLGYCSNPGSPLHDAALARLDGLLPVEPDKDIYVRNPIPIYSSIFGINTEQRMRSRPHDSSLNPLYRALVPELLKSPDIYRRHLGARILLAFGEKEDVPLLMEALNLVIAATLNDEEEKYALKRWGLALTMVEVASRFISKGFVPASLSDSPADEALRALQIAGGARPEGWKEFVGELAARKMPFMRAMAAMAFSDELAQAHSDVFRALLDDADPRVQLAACETVNSGKVSHAPYDAALLKLLATSQDFSLMGCLRAAAQQMGSVNYVLGIAAQLYNRP